MSEVFVDKLNLTFPLDHGEAVRDSLQPVLDMAGGEEIKKGLYRFVMGGTCSVADRYRVLTVQWSGQSLAQLRLLKLFDSLLRAVSEHPHRISLMHATLDVSSYPPPILHRLYKAGTAGRVRLTRKAVPPKQVSKVFSPNDRGDDTGTVYLGKKRNEAYAKVYDKGKERLDNAGEVWPDTVRFELGVTHNIGITLRDVYEPGPVFYHCMSPDLIEAPPGTPAWTGYEGGFELPKRPPPLPAQRLGRLLENSSDIRRALQLAEQIGPHGMDFLYHKLDLLRSQAACAPLGQPTALSGVAPAASAAPRLLPN